MAILLVIDDSESQRAKIRAAVEDSCLFEQVIEAHDGLRGLKLMLSEQVDVVLCDLHMPGLDGEKLLHAKDTTPGARNVPFLFLTGSTDVQHRARLLDGGACDAIVKPFHPADLVARLRLHLKVKRLQDELLIKNATLERLSTTDELTGLRNRRYVNDFLAVEFLRARRYHNSLSVVMADLDHFKRLNDEYGHPAGDAVLRGVAETLRAALRATDVGARWGGEELMVVLPQNDMAGAQVMADRWRKMVSAASFELPEGGSASVTVSLGVAGLWDDMDSPDDLVQAADEALYLAKEKGRNRVELYRD